MMDWVSLAILALIGAAYGRLLGSTVNWLNIDGFQLPKDIWLLELVSAGSWLWSFLEMPSSEATIFSLLAPILVAVSWVDLWTFQIPLIFMIAGAVISVAGILFELTTLNDAFWGFMVGSIVPLVLMGVTYLFTKRQGMGFGDIQLGFVLGVWLGPVRMALTLFGASFLSLIVWAAISLNKGFNKDRALPFAPFLAIAGIGTFIGSVYFPSFFYHLIFY